MKGMNREHLSARMQDYPLRTHEWDVEDHVCLYCEELIEVGEQYHRSYDFWAHHDCSIKYEG